MTISERALKVKFKLWQRFRANKNVITEKILREAVYATGLSKASRGLKAVISYMRDYRHLGKSGGYYYIIYEKKEQANPRDIILKEERDRVKDLLLDVVHQVYDFHFDSEYKLYSSLMKMMIDDLQSIQHFLEEKGSYTIQFRKSL